MVLWGVHDPHSPLSPGLVQHLEDVRAATQTEEECIYIQLVEQGRVALRLGRPQRLALARLVQTPRRHYRSAVRAEADQHDVLLAMPLAHQLPECDQTGLKLRV